MGGRSQRETLTVQGTVTERAYRHLSEHYSFVERGPMLVKGKGEMKTWFLKGRLVSARQERCDPIVSDAT